MSVDECRVRWSHTGCLWTEQMAVRIDGDGEHVHGAAFDRGAVLVEDCIELS